MWRSVLGGLSILALAREAGANGRPAGTSTINFRRGMDSTILAGMTFGALVSKDSGATWEWMCEDAVGYGGMYDPDYAISPTGAVFATTFDGLRVMRDGCSFAPTPFGPKFVTTTTVGPDGAVFAAVADPKTDTSPGDSKIYRSDDDGGGFMVAGTPGLVNDWWESLEVAPSDRQRVYLTGYRFVPDPGGGGNIRVQIASRSDDGGAAWTALPTDQLATMPNSTISIVAISKTNPDVVYARVALEDNSIVDGLYRSDTKGQTWTKVLSKQGPMSVVLRANGELVAGTPNAGAFRSIDQGANWTPLANPPHVKCLVENAAGEVWACTSNFGSPQVPADGFGIMKSTDLVTWTGVLKYQDIKLPVACNADTVQYQKCDHNPSIDVWCGLCAQFGCDPKRACPGAADGPTGDGTPPQKGCCQTGNGAAPGALVLGAAVGVVMFRPRRRRGS